VVLSTFLVSSIEGVVLSLPHDIRGYIRAYILGGKVLYDTARGASQSRLLLEVLGRLIVVTPSAPTPASVSAVCSYRKLAHLLNV
jgi:hypothetical protein